jgi:hypothetical protein
MSEPQAYRALTRIHLPPPEEGHLEAKEVILFDGKVIKREDGSEVKLPYPSALNGAIKAGWLVPVESEKTKYVPQPAGVEVHQAQSTTEKREKVNVMTVQDEERDLGSRVAVRQDADQSSSQRVSQAAPTGVVEHDDSGGVVVGKLGSPKGEAIEIGKGDQALKSKLDNAGPVKVQRVARATGDVQEARVGDDLQDLLPDAASSETPEPGVFSNDGVQVSSAGSSVGGQDEGQVVSKVGEPRPVSKDLDRNTSALEAALRSWALKGQTWDGKPAHLGEIQVMAKSVLRSLDAIRSELAALKAAPTAEPSEEEVVQDEVLHNPAFTWDTSAHWRTRLKTALDDHGDDPETLQAILIAENSDGVKKGVQARLDELSA